MIDPRLGWFAIGTLFGAVLMGWPWHSRFSRYSRRGSNPPPPCRGFNRGGICPNLEPPLRLLCKPLLAAPPPAGPPEQPLTAQLIRYWAWEQEQVRQAWIDPALGEPWPEDRKPAPPAGPPALPYGWGAGQLNPPPPAPGMRREWLWSPSHMAECGGPCWEAQDPRCCDCGALWRDVTIRMDEGQTQRGNGNGGPTTPKPPIKPRPTGGRLFINNKPPKES